MSALKIIEPGFLTTIQDGGRYGYRSFGLPVSGAMDWYSQSIANLLVGNEPGEAALEATFTGPVIEFRRRTMIAITGADMQPFINGKPVDAWTAVITRRRDRLSFGSLTTGARVYIAVAGGFDIPEVMGSTSTYLRGKLGGYKGRNLIAGDTLSLHPSILLFRKKKKLPVGLIPQWGKSVTLHVIKGIDYDAFPASTIETLVSSPYTVTNYSDRMGIRLNGECLHFKGSTDIISYPLAVGTVQVPGDGNPVIMLADSQTIGGYAQIANIISADIWKTGQLKPGDTIRFRMINADESLRLLKENIDNINNVFGYRKTQSVNKKRRVL